MAGAGYKSWVDGDILTAADVNTYLMQQAVMRFADSAARTSAIAAPSEGMVTYLVDTDRIEYYDGAAWQPILDQDVIEAKGDLIVGTADDTVSRLAVGTNGYVLTADSAEATGMKWAAQGTAGKVLQVVSATYSTEVSINTTTYTDSGLSASITPASATNKILAMFHHNIYLSGTPSVRASMQFLRDASTILTVGTGFNDFTYYVGANSLGGVFGSVYLDSPATTSSVTYKTQFKIGQVSETIVVNKDAYLSSLVLMEIEA